MTMKHCVFCNAETTAFTNYCNWDCLVGMAKAEGGKTYLPNGLPIKSVKADNSMWEHEHGDHPDYKFPVEVEYVGVLDKAAYDDYNVICGEETTDETKVRNLMGETHALIYTDRSIAVTMYECCYAMWHVRDGKLKGGSLWMSDAWKLSDASLEMIKRKTK